MNYDKDRLPLQILGLFMFLLVGWAIFSLATSDGHHGRRRIEEVVVQSDGLETIGFVMFVALIIGVVWLFLRLTGRD